MGSPLVIPFLLFLIEFVSLSAASSLCQNDQSLALLQFKQSFNITTDPFDSCAYYSYDDQNSYPRTSSWNSSIDCCMWDGVTCDELSGEVIELDLSCSLLVGTIHSNSSLFHLSHLQKLNLAFNDFYPSSISHKFGDFSYLTHLNLSQSIFSGQIPTNVLRLPNLVSLDLSEKFYSTGLILEPHNFKFFLQNSTQIREILLDRISIGSVIPPNLSPQITTLSLSDTGLRGSLPSSIFRLPNLNRLILSSNENLTVHFPNARWNNSLSITDLDFGNTRCSPNIVESLANLSSVKYLGLANCGLSGKVPETILSLKQLTTLDLSHNNLEGDFADLFIKLWRVKKLYLSDNNIGQFPSSTNITQLEVLNVRNNSLYGTLPSWFFNLSTLYILDLSSNRLQGSIPSSLSEIKNLFILYLSSNNFSGNIELTMFSNLKRLGVLDLSNNRLSVVSNREINSTGWSKDLYSLRLSSCNLMNLSFLRDLKSLRILDLSNNKIQGRIPEWAWSNWRDNLRSLNLSHNYLTSVEGTIQLHSVGVIDLRFNLLEGPLPIPSSPMLDYFFASQNKFSGEVPLSLCNLRYLTILDLANNSLSGAIPQCLGNSRILEVLDMHNNELRGSIPSNFFAGNQWLHTLNLRENKLEGRIPRSLANCTNLEVLDLESNNLSDIFPEWLAKLPKLQVLSLRSNNFHGTITTSSTAKNMSSQLKIIDLSHNNFTGHLPVWLFNTLTALQNTEESRKPRGYFGDENLYYYKDSLVMVVKGSELQYERVLTVLTTIDLSSNQFEGNIPGVIGQLLSLRDLNLSHNMLCGSIPHSLGNLSLLESLDLSSNQLVGRIPNELASITFLSVLNLSNNHLTGCIPKGEQFNTFDNTSYQGNEGLLGFPMTKDCGNGGTSPQEEEEDSNESILDEGFSWKAVLLGYGCGIVFGFVVGSLMLLTRKPYCLTRIAEEEAYKIMMKAKRKRKNTPRSGRRRSS